MDPHDFTFDPPSRDEPVSLPPRRPPPDWRKLVVDYNPFYLLSAVSMLLGLLTLSNTTTWNPVPLGRLLPLVATLEVYQFACLGIGLLLYRRLGPRRDAVQLLALVMLFAVDVSFLMSEIATESVLVGSLVGGGLLVLALAQGAAILAVVRPKMDPALLVTGVVGLVALHAIPVVLTAVDDDRGGVTVAHFYGLWWLICLAPLLAQTLGRLLRRDGGRVEASRWAWAVAVLPWASLLVHAGVLHYVYDRPFMAPMAAPVFVGLALLFRGETAKGDVLFLRNALLVAAAVCSLGNPAKLAVELPAVGVTLETAIVGVGAAWLGLAYVNAPRLLPWFAGAGVAALGVRWFGPSADQVGGGVRWGVGSVRRIVWALVPRTRGAWGAVAVAGAFAFLGLGALLSFGRRQPSRE